MKVTRTLAVTLFIIISLATSGVHNLTSKYARNGNPLNEKNAIDKMLAAEPTSVTTTEYSGGNASKYYNKNGGFDAEDFFKDNDNLWGESKGAGEPGQDAIIEIHVIDGNGQEYIKRKVVHPKKKKERTLSIHPNETQTEEIHAMNPKALKEDLVIEEALKKAKNKTQIQKEKEAAQ